jgi:hypothetical protein
LLHNEQLQSEQVFDWQNHEPFDQLGFEEQLEPCFEQFGQQFVPFH